MEKTMQFVTLTVTFNICEIRIFSEMMCVCVCVRDIFTVLPLTSTPRSASQREREREMPVYISFVY